MPFMWALSKLIGTYDINLHPVPKLDLFIFFPKKHYFALVSKQLQPKLDITPLRGNLTTMYVGSTSKVFQTNT